MKIAFIVGGIMTAAAYLVLLERRMAAWVQDRRGPNRVGVPLSVFIPGMKDLQLFGLGQPAADGLKMILKEEYTPAHVDKRLVRAGADCDSGRGAGDFCRDSVRQQASARSPGWDWMIRSASDRRAGD